MSDVANQGAPALNRPFAWWALIGAAGLFLLELIVIGTIFKHTIEFNCLANWPEEACSGASGIMVSIYCMMGALTLLWMLRPAPFHNLVAQAGDRFVPLLVNLVGALITLIPIPFLVEGSGTSSLLPAFGFWTLGMTLMLVGLGLFIAPLPRWRSFFAQNWTSLLPVLAVGALAPSFATVIRPIWRLDTIADWTFDAVAWAIRLVGYDVETDAQEKIIGAGDFYISVAPQCSGVEGFALVTLFVTLYLSLFRKDLRFPRAFLLFPIGLAASAAFNIFRIALLLIIGLEGNPDLAVGGFHSHAGWLMFTLVALGLIALAQTVPALQKEYTGSVQAAAAPLPLLQDPMVARILPFAVFMLSALLASAFSSTPALHYPTRVLLMAATLGLFWQIYIRLPWRLDPVALAAGAFIGLYWVMIPVAPTDVAPYGALAGAALLGWYVMRGIGTIVLIPIIEELFFRDYLETRLRFGTGLAWQVLAAFITAGLFAALHDRWIEAFAAGLIFSWIAQRRGNITDAILAHAAANAIVYGTALITGNLAII